MGKLKDFKIMMKESAAQSDAAECVGLKNENERLRCKNNALEVENDVLKDEIQALKNFIQKIIIHAANVYSEDVAESVRLQKTHVNHPKKGGKNGLI